MQVFGGDASTARAFVGGAALQGYLTATAYHRYHSPISGRVVAAHRVPGLLFSISPSMVPMFNVLPNSSKTLNDAYLDFGQYGLIQSELYLAHVATRCIFLLESPQLGLVAMVTIGMTEVSSCTIDAAVLPGAALTKGQELGYFQYGGSTAVLFVQKRAVQIKEKCLMQGNLTVNDFWAVGFSSPRMKMGTTILDLRCVSSFPLYKTISDPYSHTHFYFLSAFAIPANPLSLYTSRLVPPCR